MNWCWSWSSSIFITWCQQQTHWTSPWFWARLSAEGEEGVRGWDDLMASLMQWTWTWANPRRWWGAGKPGMLQSMGSQRVGPNWVIEQHIYFFFLYLAPPSTMVFYLRILKKFGVWNIWVQISVPLSWMKLSKFLTFCCTSIVSTVKWEWSLLTEDTRESSVQRQWGWSSSSFTLHFVICSQRTQNPRSLKTRQFVNFELKEEKSSPRAREREIPCRPFHGCSLSLFERTKYWAQCFPDCKTKASMYINACVCAKSLQPCSTLCNPTSCSLQATLPMGFSRKEYWLLCPPPRDLPSPGI